ncbi:methyl-accepting chemotaxis protein [Bacillus sp. REN10]|uniref:methyl-accepting chemotaxis protein n=1 Tax=Bacillus sp. REN10 TaxID=2782541 RepID=UPI00193B4A7A|nr:methyl-accepting chemotaxis protein [Bacillus sp. REN10]
MQFKSVKMRTLVFMLPLLIFIVVSIMLLTYWKTKDALEKEIQTSMENKLDHSIEAIENDLTTHAKIPELIARELDIVTNTLTVKQYEEIVKKSFATHDSSYGGGVFFAPYTYKKDQKFFSTYAYKEDGGMKTTDVYNDPSYNYPSQEWYTIGENTQKSTVFSPAYYDQALNVSMITVTAPFYNKDNQFSGVVTGDIDLSNLKSLVSHLKVGKTGHAFLLDQKGNFLASPHQEETIDLQIENHPNQSLAAIGKDLTAKESGQLQYEDKNGKNQIFFKKIPETGWTIALVAPEKELYGSLTSLIKLLIVVSIIGLALIVGLILFYTNGIVRNIKEVNRLAEAVAECDLTQSIDSKSQDEFGQMIGYLNKMKDNLTNIVYQLNDQASQVAATSEELSASAMQTSKATEQISSSIQEMAHGAEVQASNVSSSHEVMIDMVDQMEQARTSVSSITEAIEQTNSKAELGYSKITESLKQIQHIDETQSATANKMKELGQKSTEIGKIIDFITDISTETNLLALNAAIEAARAGEHGKGFAIVADEVKKLAEQSAQAADSIKSLITDIQTVSMNVTEAMNTSTDAVKQGLSLSNETGVYFNDIVEMIKEVKEQSTAVSTMIKQVTNSTQKLTQGMDEIHQLGIQSAANTQNVAAAAEEQNAAMDDISASAHALSQLADELQASVNRFKM